jgi:hypothetical protein
MSAFIEALFKEGLRRRFPGRLELKLHEFYLDRLAKYHIRRQ